MPDRIVKKLGPRKSIIMAFALLTLIFFGTIGILAWVVIDQNELNHKTNKLAKESKILSEKSKNLSEENRKRIMEIQRNRLESCKRTYSGVYRVFKPLLPKDPTPQEQKNVDKFKRRVAKLIDGCYKQIHPLGKGVG